ncbi:MAG: endonuclease I, partial [Bacteroidota bacterium]
MLKTNLTLLLTFVSSLLFAQVPTYYNDVNLNLTGQALKNELADKITNSQTTVLSYTPGVWNALKQTDLVPGGSSSVVLIYGYNDSDGVSNTDRTRGVNDN